jgi:predicted enzyme related to lactoylglutathione lyase
MKHTIVHFEIPADDLERARTFYSQLFGWKIEPAGGFQEYLLIQTGEEGKDLGGGMMKRQAPGQTPINYVHVESVAEYAAKAEKLGGRIIVPRSPVPGMGWFACGLDTEGNPFALWENDPSAA